MTLLIPDDEQSTTQTTNDILALTWNALENVHDPEIPVLSVTDLGIIASVRAQGDQVVIDMTPTFVGCPAVDVIRRDIEESVRRALKTSGITPFPPGGGWQGDAVLIDVLNEPHAKYRLFNVRVNVVYDPPWSSDRISERGRKRLKEFGLAPPGPRCNSTTTMTFPIVSCPFCDSEDTELDSLFGPTLCRSIHYCRNCRQSFEHMKPVGEAPC